MVSKKSKLPAEAIELYNVYIHGGMSRRDFLDGARQFAVGGLTAAAIVEGLLPHYAEAQQVPKDDKRLKTEYATVPSPQGNGSIKGYLARPTSASGKLPGILVIRTESRSDGSSTWQPTPCSCRWAARPAPSSRRARSVPPLLQR